MNYRDALEATRGRENRRRRDEDDVLGIRERCDRDDGDVLGARRRDCPQRKGTVLRIFIPAGAEINLLNLIEIASPGGICIIVRLPFLEKFCDRDSLGDIFDSIKRAGGRVEFLE